jgi:hypothetical protein
MTRGTGRVVIDSRSRVWQGALAGSAIHPMKKLLSLVFVVLVVAFPLRAQQTTPAGKRSTPAPTVMKRSTPAGARPSTPAAPGLDMPVEAKPNTPKPAPPAPKSPGNWEVYPADKMPPGKSITQEEAVKLTSGEYLEKKLYLVGSFYVAATHKDRAILRGSEKRGLINVVASYPVSIPAPQEGATLVREEPRGFRITRVKRASADEVTIYVRDITLP